MGLFELLTEGAEETKTYGLVSSRHAVDRVGALRLPTLLYQQTNPYRVVC